MHKSAGVPRGRLSSDCCLLTAKIRQAAISKSMQNIAKPKCLGARGSINLVMVPIVSLTPRIMTHCTVSYKYTGPIACLMSHIAFRKNAKAAYCQGGVFTYNQVLTHAARAAAKLLRPEPFARAARGHQGCLKRRA